MTRTRIVGISGSLRAGSYNRALLWAAARTLPPGAEFEEWDGLARLPIFDEGEEAFPPAAVLPFLAAVADADGLLIATPEYNASLPGGLKNALDWASRPFPDNVLRGKPCLVIGASTGLFGAVWAQAELRKVLKTSGACPLDFELPVGMANTAFSETGALADAELAERLAAGVGALLREIDAGVQQPAA